MAKRSWLLAVLLALLMTAGCANSSTGAATSRPSSVPRASGVAEEIVPSSSMDTFALRKAPYTKLSELTENADAIVRGTVTSVRYVTRDSFPQTIYTVTVSKSWSPSAMKGDTVTVVRDGGIWSRADSMRFSGRLDQQPSAADEAAKVRMLIDGRPLPEVGDEAIYFLVSVDSKVADELGVPDLYVVDGSIQGQIDIRDGVAKRFSPSSADPDFLGSRNASVLEDEITAAPKKAGV